MNMKLGNSENNYLAKPLYVGIAYTLSKMSSETTFGENKTLTR